MFLVTAFSVVPVIGHALALKRRLDRLKDHQLFVALSTAQTDLESMERSFGALSVQAKALRSALDRITESLGAIRRAAHPDGLAELKSQVASLLSVLR